MNLLIWLGFIFKVDYLRYYNIIMHYLIIQLKFIHKIKIYL